MIDDVTFGRTDLPELSIDNDFIKFVFHAGQEMTPQTINVFSDRTKAPITLTLTPSGQKKYFKVSHSKLPSEGGTIAVGFKSNDTKTHAAALLIQTRGAEPIVVKLLAQPIDTGIDDITSNGENVPSPAIIGSQLVVRGNYQHYQLFSTDGCLLQQGTYQEQIDLSHLHSKIFILKLRTDNVVRSFSLIR